MKNILITLFAFVFLGINEGIFAQTLSTIEELRTCSVFKDYVLYLEATPPTPGCTKNFISFQGSHPYASISDWGNGVGAAIPKIESSTGWAYPVTVYIKNRYKSFTIRENIYGASCATSTYTRIIIPREAKQPSKITEIEILGSNLCNGTLNLRAANTSITHDEYQWFYQSQGGINYFMATTTTNTVTLNIGSAITSDFKLGVLVRNRCGISTYYTGYIPVSNILTPMPTITIPRTYCEGRKNEFSLDPVAIGVEYKWVFIDHTNNNTETLVGLNKYTCSPNFGTSISGIGTINSYTIELWAKINCNWVFIESKFEGNITYSNCSGSSARVANQSTSLESLIEHSIDLDANNVKTNSENQVNNNTFSVVKGQDKFTTAYPNPTTGLVELRSKGLAIEAVNVYNITGVLVTQQLNISTTNPTLDLSKLPKGMYMVNIQTATSNKTIQVVKQ